MSSNGITDHLDPLRDRRRPEVDEDYPPEIGVPQDDRNMALLSHAGGYFTSIIVPLVLYTVAKGRSPFLDHHNREALNFQITEILFFFVLGVVAVVILVLVGASADWETAAVVALTLFGIPTTLFAIFEIVVIILACVAAYRGRLFRYPLCLRLVKRPSGATSTLSDR
jgi:uncharacterized Tic20 family protein